VGEIGVDTAEDVEVLWKQMGSISLLRSKLAHLTYVLVDPVGATALSSVAPHETPNRLELLAS